MRIMIVGVFSDPYSTNHKIVAALESLGHQVHKVDYRRALKAGGPENAEHEILTATAHVNPRFVMVCKGLGLWPETLTKIRAISPVLYWFMDPIASSRIMTATAHASAADWCSVTSTEVRNEFLKVNPRTFVVYEGFDPSTFYKIVCKKPNDVLFFGSTGGPRDAVLNALYTAKDLSLMLYGAAFGRSVWGRELNTEMNRSKMVLNICWSDIFSNRVMQTLGSGALLLTNRCSDLTTEFEGGKHLVYYDSPSDCIDKARYYAAHEKKRKQIAAAGQWESRKFTWVAQMTKLLEHMYAKTATTTDN